QLVSMGLLHEALFCCDRAITLLPDCADFHCARAGMLLRLYDGKRAETSFRRALELEPRSKEALSGLGWALRMLGRFAEADACNDRLRALDPSDLRDVRHVPSTGNRTSGVGEIDRLTSVLDNTEAKSDDRITAGFALGRMLEDAGQFDE